MQLQEKRSTATKGTHITRAVKLAFGNDQILHIRRRLLTWGRANYQPFPWRSETNPWLTFVAEILLQRTRAQQVEPVYLKFRERYPTAKSLVHDGMKAVRKITDKLGLHWRAPLLLEVARKITNQGGTPPQEEAALRQFKGVGMYTTAAWLSLYCQKRSVIIDANIARWLSRITGLPYNRDPRHVHWVQVLAERLTPMRAFRNYNYAVLDFTMSVCTSRTPRCTICPLSTECNYDQTQRQASKPTIR